MNQIPNQTQTNLDPGQVRQNTSYPFDNRSTLQVDIYKMSPVWISSLQLQVQSAVFPLHVSRIYTSGQHMYWQISDARYEHIATFSFSHQGQGCAVAYRPNGCICGYMTYARNMISFFSSVVRNQYGDSLQLPSNCMILCANCITCTYTTGCQSIRVNGTDYNGATAVVLQRNVVLDDYTDTYSVTVSVFGDYQGQIQIAATGTPVLKTVNGVDLTNKHLLIKPRTLSDLRVITAGNTITMAGVLDA